MASVTLPMMFKDLTGGLRRVEAVGATVGEIVAALDARFPGIAEKMRTGGKLVPTVAITVDGKIAARGLATPVGVSSEVVVHP